MPIRDSVAKLKLAPKTAGESNSSAVLVIVVTLAIVGIYLYVTQPKSTESK